MTQVLAERMGDKIHIHSEFYDKDTCKALPGSKWDREARAWTLPLAWSSAVMLRTAFGSRLTLGPELKLWAWAWRRELIDPAMAIREALEADPVKGADQRLFPHQHAAVRFMTISGQVCIADQMGTGKTAQAITAVDVNHEYPCLVICPNSVVRNWEREFAMWAPAARVAMLKGGKQNIIKEIERVRLGEADVAVINWEALRLYSRQQAFGNVTLPDAAKVDGPLNTVPWRTVIADEAHKLISPKSAWTRAAWYLAHQSTVTARYALTGTPMANSPDDFWSILHFIAPDEFPARSKYIDRYCMTSWNVWGGMDVVGVRPEMREEWDKVVLPRLRSIPIDAVRKLPPLKPTVRYVEMSAKQKKAYLQMEETMAAQVGDEVVFTTNAVSKLTRLTQFASAYAEVVGDNQVRLSEPSSKLDELDAILEETGDEPVVVFAVSKQLIDLAAVRLEKAGVSHGLITGSVDEKQRQVYVDRFQDGQLHVMLCTLGAGSVGITLTRSRIAVFLERSWRMIDNVQAERRVLRIGSEHHDNIAIIDVVSLGTVDERRLEVNELKQERLEELIQQRDFLLRMLKPTNKKGK